MKKEIEATGFESAIISSWEGWDGDQECLQFYDAVLTKEYAEQLGMEKVSYVEFNMANSTVTFMDSFDPHMKPHGDYLFNKTFKLLVSLGEEL